MAKMLIDIFGYRLEGAGRQPIEIATDNPKFTVDEPLDELGSHLKLPKQYAGSRGRIEKALPGLRVN